MSASSHSVVAVVIAISAALAGCQRGGDAQALVAEAKSDIDKRDFKSAIIRAKNVLQNHSDNGEARLLLGQGLLETGDATGAALELRKALELGIADSRAVPLLAKATLLQGEARAVVQQYGSTQLADAAASADLKTTVAAAHLALKDPASARQTIADALKDSPRYAPAILLQARLTASDNVPGAMALIDELLGREPGNGSALLMKGDLQRGPLQQQEAALATYRAAAKANPSSVAAHAAVIGLLMERSDMAGAKAELQVLQQAQPNHPETRLFEAQLAFVDKNYAKAREIADGLLKVAPNDPRLLQLAGASEMRLNALTAAENHLGQVLKILPQAMQPRQLLAQIYLSTGQPEKALAVLRPMHDANAGNAESFTLLGQAYLQQGELARSEAAFAQANKIDPKATRARTALALNQLAKGKTSDGFAGLEAAAAEDSGTRSNLALIAARLRANDLDGAMKAIDALDKKQPGQAITAVLRGNVQLQCKDTPGATASFEKALTLDKTYFPAVAALAAMDLRDGKPDAARKRFDDVLRADPKNPRALLALAELQARNGGSKEEVVKALGEAIRANPSELAARGVLVRYLIDRHDSKAAVVAAQEAAAALPDSPEVLDLLGTAQLSAGQPQQAVGTFVKLTAMRSGQAEPELKLASAHVAANDLDAARRSIERALKIKPGFRQAQLAQAELALLQKNTAVALDVAKALQKSDPKQPVGYMLAADAESQAGRTDAAAAALRQAISLGAGTEAAVKMHRLLLAGQRKDEADKWAASWRKDHPRDAAFVYYLGDTALARNDMTVAEGEYRRVLEVQPDNALALNNVAWLLTRQQKPGAVALAERANKLMPEQPALMDTLALALAAENQVPRAIELQKKALAQSPDNPQLRLSLAKLYLQAGDKTQARAELDAVAKFGAKFPAQAEVAQLIKTL